MDRQYDGQGQRDIGTVHMDGLYRYAVLLTDDQIKAEAIVEETYLHVIHAKQGPPEKCNTKCWLYTTLRGLWCDEATKPCDCGQKSTEDEHDDYALGASANRFCNLDLSQVEPEQVREALQRLPLQLREIILLREFERLPYDQIATVLGCCVATVMSRLTQARRTLFGRLAGAPAKANLV
jgi:RNA polymerase sigma-70 factor, ECF subfamily